MSTISDNFIPYWPNGVDGTEKYPQYHHLISESKQARVVRVIIKGGEAELPHTHMSPSVMFVDQPTTLLVKFVDELGKEKLVYEATEKRENPTRPEVQKMSPEPFHYVTNTENKDYLATRIEIKQEKASYDLKDILIEKKPFSVEGEGYLVGNVNTTLKIYQERIEILPLDTLSNRPPIWRLQPKQQYLFENLGIASEKAYLLEIPL